MSVLAGRVAAAERDEIARAVRALLATPFLSAEDDPAAFDIVRRRHQHLVEWFDRHCGWRLHVDVRGGYARLLKVSDRPDPTRPVRRQRSTKAPFDRRRYALLCVVCAELLTTPTTTIGLLASRVTEATAADAEVPTFDAARREERAAYVDALTFLEHLRMIRADDGITENFVDSTEAKVLYQVDTSRLLHLLAAPVPPSRVSAGDVDALVAEQRYGEAADPDADVADAQRNLWLRHSVTRRLLDDPVVYEDELTDEQRAYLASPTGRRLVREVAEEAGFVLEDRAEGWMLIDLDAVATDDRFPRERSNAKQAALLLLDRLLAAAGAPVPVADLTAEVAGWLDREPSWARAYQSEGGAARLVTEALDVLCAFGLASRTDEGVRCRPAAARYAASEDAAASPAARDSAAPTIAGAGDSQLALGFDSVPDHAPDRGTARTEPAASPASPEGNAR